MVESEKRGSSVVSAHSRYKQGLIQSENLKFESLCKVVFGSQMTKEQMKREIIDYVRCMETNYKEHITNLQIKL